MKLRARRLTLAPGTLDASHCSKSSNAEEEDQVDVERRRAEGRAALSRAVEIAVEASRRPKPVHEVQEQPIPIMSKFWSQSCDSDSDIFGRRRFVDT